MKKPFAGSRTVTYPRDFGRDPPPEYGAKASCRARCMMDGPIGCWLSWKNKSPVVLWRYRSLKHPLGNRIWPGKYKYIAPNIPNAAKCTHRCNILQHHREIFEEWLIECIPWIVFLGWCWILEPEWANCFVATKSGCRASTLCVGFLFRQSPCRMCCHSPRSTGHAMIPGCFMSYTIHSRHIYFCLGDSSCRYCMPYHAWPWSIDDVGCANTKRSGANLKPHWRSGGDPHRPCESCKSCAHKQD